MNQTGPDCSTTRSRCMALKSPQNRNKGIQLSMQWLEQVPYGLDLLPVHLSPLLLARPGAARREDPVVDLSNNVGEVL